MENFEVNSNNQSGGLTAGKIDNSTANIKINVWKYRAEGFIVGIITGVISGLIVYFITQ